MISHCSLTVKQHYQHCHPQTNAAKAARALIIILRWPRERQLLCFYLQPLPPPLSPFPFKCLSTHIKTKVKCTRRMLCPRQIRSSCIQTRGTIRRILQTSACSPCPHHLHRSPCGSKTGCGDETKLKKVTWSGLFCCQERPEWKSPAAGTERSNKGRTL